MRNNNCMFTPPENYNCCGKYPEDNCFFCSATTPYHPTCAYLEDNQCMHTITKRITKRKFENTHSIGTESND